jgi:hypothetical protein
MDGFPMKDYHVLVRAENEEIARDIHRELHESENAFLG